MEGTETQFLAPGQGIFTDSVYQEEQRMCGGWIRKHLSVPRYDSAYPRNDDTIAATTRPGSHLRCQKIFQLC